MRSDRSHNLNRARAFTIIELLTVIGIIALLAVLTTLGARRLTAGSRLAAGTNAVTNAVGIARALAIRDSSPTAVVFRVVWDPLKPQIPQRVECVLVRATGEQPPYFNQTNQIIGYKQRYLPVADAPITVLPEGVKVACPIYEYAPGPSSIPEGGVLVTQPELRLLVNCSESAECSRQIAVLFGSRGEFLTRAPEMSDLDSMMFVDWNGNGSLASPPVEIQDSAAGTCADPSANYEKFWWYDHPADENNLLLAPFLVVYDDKAARELKGSNWSSLDNLLNELTGPNGYITLYGDRISFNRFSGLPERKVR